jgi:hypothetical protein
MSGAGLANDGECYNFGYAQVKKGRIIKEEE